VVESIGADILDLLLFLAGFRHAFFEEHQRMPTAAEFAEEHNEGNLTSAEDRAIAIVRDLEELFGGARPAEIGEALYSALRLRWGYVDGTIRKLKEAAKHEKLSTADLARAEISLVGRLGWRVDESKKEFRSWLRT
jgi:hypothetical protein